MNERIKKIKLIKNETSNYENIEKEDKAEIIKERTKDKIRGNQKKYEEREEKEEEENSTINDS